MISFRIILGPFPPLLLAFIKDFLFQATRGILLVDEHSVDTIFWKDSSTGILSLKAAWDLVRSQATPPPWIGLIWNKVVNPRLACFAWRLLLRKLHQNLWPKVEVGTWLLDAIFVIYGKKQTPIFSSYVAWPTPFGPGF